MNTTSLQDGQKPGKRDFIWPVVALMAFIVLTCVVFNTLIAVSLHARRKYRKRKQLARKSDNEVNYQTQTPVHQALDFSSLQTSDKSEHNYDKIHYHDSIKAASSYGSNLEQYCQSFEKSRSEGLEDNDYAVLNSVKDYHLDTENNFISPYAVSPVIPIPTQMLEEIRGETDSFGSMHYINIQQAETHWKNLRSWTEERRTITESNLQELAQTL